MIPAIRLTREPRRFRAALLTLLLIGLSTAARAQGPSTPDPAQAPAPAPATPAGPTFEIYGFAMADAIVDFRTNNPDWYDVVRPSKLPAFRGEFGQDGHFYLSPRQSRLGVKADWPTSNGPVKAVFEFEMFGVGVDAGQTTIRLRHAYGEWHSFGAGQTNSQFTDVDVFPNIIEYWGPNGMLFYRNVQVYWKPRDDDHMRIAVAIERPGASGDAGRFSDRIELQNILARFPAPDLTGHVRIKGSPGYLQVGGVIRRIDYDDTLEDRFDLSGHATGWGISLSSNVNASSNNVFRLQYIFGEGVENYFNDAPVDVGVETNPGNLTRPVRGEALPDQGIVAFLDHTWNSTFTTSAGYSRVDIKNSDGQTGAAFKSGQYAILNLLATPVTNVMMGAEAQWGRRENNFDGFNTDDYRLQFSFKYSFSQKFGS